MFILNRPFLLQYFCFSKKSNKCTYVCTYFYNLRLFTNYRRMPLDMIFRWFVCKMHISRVVFLCFGLDRDGHNPRVVVAVQNGRSKRIAERAAAQRQQGISGWYTPFTDSLHVCRVYLPYISCEYSARRPSTMPTCWRRPRRIPKTSRDG